MSWVEPTSVSLHDFLSKGAVQRLTKDLHENSKEIFNSNNYLLLCKLQNTLSVVLYTIPNCEL